MINIDEIISDAAKSKSPFLGVFRLIKAEFLKWQKDNPGKEIDERQQVKILQKMYDQRMESMKIYEQAGRKELMENEAKEALIISTYLPAPIPDEEIEDYTKGVIEDHFAGKVTMRDMKPILAYVQEKYPDASGKIVSKVVKSYA